MRRLFITLFLVLLLAFSAHAASQATSSTAASTIITNVRYYLNEAAADVWSDAELLVYINNGIYDIVQRTHCLEATADVSLVANQHEYDFSANSYITVVSVVFVDASTPTVEKGLLRKNVPGMGHGVKADGDPVYWYEWKSYIGIYPVPSSVTTEKLTVYYVSRPTALASTASNITTPAIYDKALTLYVTAQALLKTGQSQHGKSAAFMADYYTELDRFRADFIDQPKQTKDDIR